MLEIKQIARAKGKKILFRKVPDQNASAIRFYEKSGFKFHSKAILDVPLFKEELREMNVLYLNLYQVMKEGLLAIDCLETAKRFTERYISLNFLKSTEVDFYYRFVKSFLNLLTVSRDTPR